MVAHLEIGRHQSGFENPVCLNTSGANAHLLGYHDGRYRVLGETMDAGVGNAIDKFTRHVGWDHPGGPKVEGGGAAAEGERPGGPPRPPVRRQRDGLLLLRDQLRRQRRVRRRSPSRGNLFSLQEHVFAMLTEVSERALSLTGADELVLGGGRTERSASRDAGVDVCGPRRTLPPPRGSSATTPG